MTSGSFPAGQNGLPRGAYHRGGRRQGGYREAAARPGLGRAGDRDGVQGRSLSRRLRAAARRRRLGGACLPEEVDEGHQDAQTRDRPGQGPSEATEGGAEMKRDEKLEV